MVEPRELHKGDVVQIDPVHDERFGGLLMVVTEPKVWGAQGYCTSPEHNGLFYCRCPFEAMEFVGSAPWVAYHNEEADRGC